MNISKATNALIDAAEAYAVNYCDDDRPQINTDVVNAFYAGAAYATQSAELRSLYPRLIKLAGEIARCTNLPDVETWPWRDDRDMQVWDAAENAANKAADQCGEWATELRRIADIVNAISHKSRSGQIRDNSWYVDALEALGPLRFHIAELIELAEQHNRFAELAGGPQLSAAKIAAAKSASDAAEQFFCTNVPN